jgi:hypothetical protein
VWLRKGANEIVVLELEDSRIRSIAALKDPVWSNAEA